MARVKTGRQPPTPAQEVLKQAKGYYGRRKNTIRIAKQAVEKGQQYAYRDRRVSKRNFRALWIQRINAAARASSCLAMCRMNGLQTGPASRSTARFLSDLAIHEPPHSRLTEQQGSLAYLKEDDTRRVSSTRRQPGSRVKAYFLRQAVPDPANPGLEKGARLRAQRKDAMVMPWHDCGETHPAPSMNEQPINLSPPLRSRA
jgi:large subunit ribosomal protein L20